MSQAKNPSINVLARANGAEKVGKGLSTVGAILDSLKIAPVELYGAIPNDSSASAMTANETALADAEAAGYYPLLKGGNAYHVSDGYDVWQHRFFAGRGCAVFIGATEYDVSNAIWGIYRIDDFNDGTNNYITLKNARDNIVIARIARGDESGASHVFQLPLDIRRDSHSLISSPGTANGTSDVLFRNLSGEDLFYIANRTDGKLLSFLFNTTAAPDYNFDSAMDIPTEGTGNPIAFPALPVQFNQPVSLKRRAGANVEHQFVPLLDETQIRDKTSTNVLGRLTETFSEWAGVEFNPLTAPVARGNYEYARSDADNFPNTKTLKAASADSEAWIATLTVAASTSGGGTGVRETRYVWDGSTLTETDLVNTLPVQIVAQVQENGTTAGELELFTDYAGGLGGGCNIQSRLSVSTASR